MTLRRILRCEAESSEVFMVRALVLNGEWTGSEVAIGYV